MDNSKLIFQKGFAHGLSRLCKSYPQEIKYKAGVKQYMSVFNVLWEKTLNYLEEDLPMFQFNVWIKELKPVHEENGAYFFEVSSPMHKNLLEEKYAEKIRLTMQLAYEELYGVPGADIRPEFITPQDSSKLNLSRKKEEPRPVREVKTNLNPNYTFDTFVVGEANKFANAAALAVAQAPGRAYPPASYSLRRASTGSFRAAPREEQAPRTR